MSRHPPLTRSSRTVRENREPQELAIVLSAAARFLLAKGRGQQAEQLLHELEQVPEVRADLYYASALPGLARVALALERAGSRSSTCRGR